MPSFNIVRLVALFAGATVSVVLSACGSVQSVPVRDNESATFAVRATVRPSAWRGGEREGPGIAVGYEGYRAKDTQTLAAGESIQLDGGTILGPDTLRHQADMRQGYIAYNHLFRLGSHFELEPFVGATRIHLKIKSTSADGTTRAVLNNWDTGVIGGVTPRWRFNDWVAIEARLSYFNVSAWAHGQSYEAAVVLSPVPNTSLRLGYSERRYDIEDNIPGWYSEVNVRARGPMATLQFDF
jgi:hypothetical protein